MVFPEVVQEALRELPAMSVEIGKDKRIKAIIQVLQGSAFLPHELGQSGHGQSILPLTLLILGLAVQ